MRVKYFCTQAESFDNRQTPGLKRICAKCDYRFYCLTTKLIRDGGLLSRNNNKQIIAMIGTNRSSHISFKQGGQRYAMELKRIETKFGIDFGIDLYLNAPFFGKKVMERA